MTERIALVSPSCNTICKKKTSDQTKKMSQNWQDWPVSSYSTQETLEHVAEHFEYFEDDVLINTYYKSGTTLTQEIVYALLHGVEAAKASNLSYRSPFIDWGKPDPTGRKPLDWAPQLARPRVLKSHLPAAFHMRHLRADSGPRILIVMRNPKDTIVSAFHHFTNCTEHVNTLPSAFSEFWKVLSLSCRTKDAMYLNYFDFTLSWWAQRDHPRVGLYFYENMVTQKAETVRSIAQFLGLEPTEDQVQAIVDHTSFDSMRDNPNVNKSLNPALKGMWLNEFNFIRKGQVGDWKNHFTVAENELMDSLIQEHLVPVGLNFAYE